jgi:beta-glucosidase
VELEAGQTISVTLPLPASDLAYWDTASHAWVVEPGPVEVLVGRSSRDADLTLRGTVTVGP